MKAVGAALVLAASVAALPSSAADVSGPPVLPETVRPGDVFVLRPPPGRTPPASVRFLDRTYPPLEVPGERGPVFLMGLDLETPAGEASIVLQREGGETERLPLTISAREFPVERLTLPQKMVTPPQELEERIAREQALAAGVYRASGAAKLWSRRFTPPLEQKPAGNFGRRRILNGIPKSPHGGQDYSAPAGTPVRAIAPGTVRLARDFYYSGLTVFVDHGSGLVSVYMHLEKMLATEGERVADRQVIGLVGSTGRATGPHLHLGVRLFDQRVDPETLIGIFSIAPAGSDLNTKREAGISLH